MAFRLHKRAANAIRSFFRIDLIRQDVLEVHQAVAGNRIGTHTETGAILRELGSLRAETERLQGAVDLILALHNVSAEKSSLTRDDKKVGDPHVG